MNGLASVILSPVLPIWLVACAALGGFLLIVWGRTWWRMLPLAILSAALLNPRLTTPQTRPLSDVAVVAVDDSPSMSLSDRPKQVSAALSALLEKLKAQPNLEVRVEHWQAAAGQDDGTLLFQAVHAALADIPQKRLAGVFLLTDGQVRDVPPVNDLSAPTHVLLAGHRADRDRRLVLDQVPGFAIVGTQATAMVRVDDPGQDGDAVLTWSLDGGPRQSQKVSLNHAIPLTVPVSHAGSNVLEISVETVPGELTDQNNRVAVSISGVRDRLRVLLISGEPHPGERAWRNLLKADPGVDLVHFTILRAPEKDDHTPMRDLALISFPVRELFEEKLHDFDLIIFDRYRRRTVLPASYYENIARYVRQGGALLMAVGPEFSGPNSPYVTGLSEILPLAPSGQIIEQPFRPLVTPTGHRHPVTAALPGEGQWGRWLRLIGGQSQGRGQTVMEDESGRPLLVLDRQGEGRVAQLMSDSPWLWSRGWDGGGPQAELLRRLAHWLMKEPDLEEEQLTAEIRGDHLMIRRHSLIPGPEKITITAPSGAVQSKELTDGLDGIASVDMTVMEPGLWRISDGHRTALAATGQLNPVEMSEVKATPETLTPYVATKNGGLMWMEDGLPNVRRISPNSMASGSGWMGIQDNEQSQRVSERSVPMLPPFLWLTLAGGGLLLCWWREGRKK